MDDSIAEIRSKIDIVNFIGSYIALKKAGHNFKGLCPFHNEKTPSFVVSPDRQIWHCFGSCQDGGDAIKFFMKMENIGFIEALKELAQKFGVKLKKLEINDKLSQKKERILQINSLAKEFFQYILHKSQYGKRALDYLESRGIKVPIIKKFELGYAPSSWDSITKFLIRKNFSQEELFEAGLLVKSDKGRYYDRFRGRLIFPIKDVRDNVIGFSGRLLDNHDKSAKYINTPESLIYHKRESLFGIQLAKEAIKKEGNVILVEGEFDMISPYVYGVENIVAIKGSAVTKEQLVLIKRYTNRINLALDADSAGAEAMKRGIEEAESMEFDIGIIIFEGGKDPDEAVRKDPTKFKKSISQAISIYDFIINFYQKKYPGNDPFSKKNIAEGVTPYISRTRNPVIRSYTIRKLAEALGVDEKSIESLLKKQYWEKKKSFGFNKIIVKKSEIDREIILQKYLLSSIFQNEKPYLEFEKAFVTLAIDDFSVVAYQKIIEYFIKFQSSEVFKINKFSDYLPNELRPALDEIYLFATLDTDLGQENFEKIIAEIKKFSLKKKIKDMVSANGEMTLEKENELLVINKKLKELEKMTGRL